MKYQLGRSCLPEEGKSRYGKLIECLFLHKMTHRTSTKRPGLREDTLPLLELIFPQGDILIIRIAIDRPGPGIHDNYAGNILRVGYCAGQANRTAPVLHNQGYILESQGLNQGDKIVRVILGQTAPISWFIGKTQTQVVHGDTAVLRTGIRDNKERDNAH